MDHLVFQGPPGNPQYGMPWTEGLAYHDTNLQTFDTGQSAQAIARADWGSLGSYISTEAPGYSDAGLFISKAKSGAAWRDIWTVTAPGLTGQVWLRIGWSVDGTASTFGEDESSESHPTWRYRLDTLNRTGGGSDSGTIDVRFWVGNPQAIEARFELWGGNSSGFIPPGTSAGMVGDFLNTASVTGLEAYTGDWTKIQDWSLETVSAHDYRGTSAPEPAALLLLGVGASALLGVSRRLR